MGLKAILGWIPRKPAAVVAEAPPTLQSMPPPVVPTIYPDDVFIVSYPKSGNTWLRFLIANYLSDEAIDFIGLHHVMPDLHLDPALASPARNRPRFIKSHSAFDALYPRVVYLLRDPRDIAVSSYFHQRKFNLIDKQAPFEQFVQSFIEIGFYPSGPWHEHVEGWLSASSESVLRVTYEAMLADSGAELQRVLVFSGLTVEPARIARAVERSSFGRMQEIEDAQHDEYFKRYGSDTTELRFVREGRSGSWRDFFDEAQIARFLERYGETMRKFGYR